MLCLGSRDPGKLPLGAPSKAPDVLTTPMLSCMEHLPTPSCVSYLRNHGQYTWGWGETVLSKMIKTACVIYVQAAFFWNAPLEIPLPEMHLRVLSVKLIGATPTATTEIATFNGRELCLAKNYFFLIEAFIFSSFLVFWNRMFKIFLLLWLVYA